MEKLLKVNCKKCGPIKIDISHPWCDNQDGEGFIIPVKMCATMRSLKMFWNKFTGDHWHLIYDEKFEDSFEKGMLELLHTNPDEDGEDWNEHLLEPMECWRQQS